MDKVWLAQYPEGVPSEVDLHEFSSLKGLLEHSCRRFAGLAAYSNMGVDLTYGELDAKSRSFAAYLTHVLGMKKGERLAIMMPNLLQYPIALFGALRAGLIVVNVNPLYTARELEHQLRDSGATAIVVLQNFAHTLEQVLDKTEVKIVITSQVGDLLPAAKAWLVNLAVRYVKHMVPSWHIPKAISFTDALHAELLPLEDVSLHHEDVAFLQYTGGTTGVAKGAILTHGNMVANLQQAAAWLAPNLKEGIETVAIPLPLYHVYALTASLAFLKLGAKCALITNPRDMPEFLATLKKEHPTALIGVNTLYAMLLREPGIAELDLRDLKLCAAGGMAVQQAVAQGWKRASGVPLVEGYGLSEASPMVTCNRVDIEDWTGSIGLPIPSTEVAILDDEGRQCGPGETGELIVRGPQVMQGYWNSPKETERAFTRDGWLRTGDMAVMDERGYFKVTDRKKDMVIVSGFNVFPNEIEDTVMLHPGVLEVGAIGVPDERSGESVKLVVVKKDPNLTQEQLLEYCRTHLAAYKVPRVIEFRTDPLPKSAIGKVLRKELRSSVVAAPQASPR